MAPTEQPVLHRALLVDDVDDDDGVRAMVYATLEPRGFDVVAPASVTEALRHIATQSFDGLITDPHMPDPGDGLRWLRRCAILHVRSYISAIVAGVITLAQKSGQRRCYARIRGSGQ